MNTSTPTMLAGKVDAEQLQERRTRRIWYFFRTDWWETISERVLGYDIHIKTDHRIRSIFVNGEEYTKSV